jgi:hypothetical protein
MAGDDPGIADLAVYPYLALSPEAASFQPPNIRHADF